MSDPITLIPAPIVQNLVHAAEQAGAAIAHQQTADRLSPHIDRLQQQLDALRKQHAAAGTAMAAALEHADMYRAAAHGLAAHVDGLTRQMVEQAEPDPISPAPPFEPVPADAQPVHYGTCVHCRDQIGRLPGGEWSHVLGQVVCFPAASSSPHADPGPDITAEDPLQVGTIRPDRMPHDRVAVSGACRHCHGAIGRDKDGDPWLHNGAGPWCYPGDAPDSPCAEPRLEISQAVTQ